MPAKVLPDKEIERLLRQGKTDQEVVDYLRTEYRDPLTGRRVDVRRQAISMWRKRKGLPRVLPRYDDLIPWQVKTEHAAMYTPRMLRLEARQRRGEELRPGDQQRLDAFKAKLVDQDAVVHYDPDTEQGWWFVKRRPGVDTDIIRRSE